MTSAELQDAARAARDLAARHAPAAESDRALDPAVARALVSAGFARHFVPHRWGGRDGGHLDVIRAVTTVGEGCASAAWCASVIAYGGRMATFLPEEGQRELWSGTPDTVVASALQPTGRAVEEDGGWRVSGRWSYVSAVLHSDWVLLVAPTVSAADAPADETPEHRRFFAIRRDELTVEHTWRTTGMRGTGSHTVIAEAVFVPRHRSFSATALEGSTDPARSSLPLKTVAGLTFAPPLLGAARSVLRRLANSVPGHDAEPSPTTLEFVRAAGDIHLAAETVQRVARDVDTDNDRARWAPWAPWDCVRAVELSLEAVGRLMRLGGSRSFSEDDPVQRAWRDIHTGASHVRLRPELAALDCLPVLKEASVRDHH